MDNSRLSIRPLLDTDELDELHAEATGWNGEESLRRVSAAHDEPETTMVGLVDGGLAGFGFGLGVGAADGRRGVGWLYVRPSARRLGLGTLLWAEILRVCTPERVPGVMLVSGEDDKESQRVATERGARLGGLHLESSLDLTETTSIAPHAKAAAGDVVIKPLPSGATAEQWREFVELYWKLMADTPDHAEGAVDAPESVVRALIAEPWQVMGAWDGDKLIGFTSVFVTNGVKRTLNTYLTAVERDHRGRGLSTAMKAAHAIALADAGWTSIVTQNMEGNGPILASNRRLGFKPTGGLREMIYDFDH